MSTQLKIHQIGLHSQVMEPLSVDVNLPSSSTPELPKKENGTNNYETVDNNEIVFPDFRHTRRLGRGSYGTVVACFFRSRPAAAKLVETSVDFKAIRTEAELLSTFRHKNIVTLYALFHGEMSGLVLELMEGGSLSELLHQNKHIGYQTCHVLNWAAQVCEALNYLHAHNFIHRDIKPSNMLLTRNYINLKLCDFGTVAELQTSMTNNRGTAAWMAPEVFRGRKYDQQCDIFSLGISLWEMIARRQPFAELAESNPLTVLWKVAESGLRPPKMHGVPEPLMELIEGCWANDPDERPCLEEVKKTLECFIEIFPNAELLPLVDRSTGRFAEAPPPRIFTPPPQHEALNPMLQSIGDPSHRRTGSHDTRYLGVPIPGQPQMMHCSQSARSISDVPAFDQFGNTALRVYTTNGRYSPNIAAGPSQPFVRQSSYNPCMVPTQHAPPAPIGIHPPVEVAKKRKKSGFMKLLSGLKKELINQ